MASNGAVDAIDGGGAGGSAVGGAGAAGGGFGDLIRAAGAVVWRPGPAGLAPQIALVHRPKYDDWSFPKGKSKRGEHELLTAIREVAEEAAVRVVLGRRLKPSEYEFGGRPKTVSYWAARCVESFDFVPGQEIDDLVWIDLCHVAERLSYDRDRLLIEEFAAGPVSTVPLILLRHAQAGTRSAQGAAADLARPLDQQGVEDAKLLAVLLASFGTCRVITSAAERCIATVRPYAQAVGMPVELEPDFTADVPAARRAVALVTELVAQGRPTLICAHRENLPVMINAARAALGATDDVEVEPQLAKGSFVVLQSADGVLVSSERHNLTVD